MRTIPPATTKDVRHGARLAGLRRITWVLIATADDGSVDCRAYGLGNRRPASRAITLDTALELKAHGVPTMVRRPATAQVRLDTATT